MHEALRGWNPDPKDLIHKSFEELAADQITRFEHHRDVLLPALEAEVARLRAAGHVFHGCDTDEVTPEGFDAKAVVARVKAEAAARHAAGQHWVGCGCRTSNSELERRGF